MDILIHNPKHPGNADKAAKLSKEQFAACQQYIIGIMNGAMNRAKRPKVAEQEAEIVKLCAAAGCPIIFED